MFVDVDYVELPTLMWELELAAPTADDLRKAEQAMGEAVPAERVFVIATQARRHLIVAGGMWVLENDLGLMETSLDRGPYTGAGRRSG